MSDISIDQQINYIWLNGELIPSDQAKIHVLTHSLHYAAGVFEGERAYAGKVFKLYEHIIRLFASAKAMNIDIPYTTDTIMMAHDLVIAKNQVEDAYIRPLVWRGSESINLINRNLSVNVMIATIPIVTKEKTKCRLCLSKWQKPHPNSWPPQAKSSGHYEMMVVAQAEAKTQGYDDALLLDYRGYIAECTTTNIFFVHQGKLITPIADVFLNGITRQTIINLAEKSGLRVEEKYINLEEIMSYEECFLTGTAAEIRSVASINIFDQEIKFPSDKITTHLTQEYQILVRN